MSNTSRWVSGTTWSLRRHAVRPDTAPSNGTKYPAACNGNNLVYVLGASDYIPSHVTKAKSVPNCKRCEKILAREAGTTFDDVDTGTES